MATWRLYTTVPVKALEATFAFIMLRALKATKNEYHSHAIFIAVQQNFPIQNNANVASNAFTGTVATCYTVAVVLACHWHSTAGGY